MKAKIKIVNQYHNIWSLVDQHISIKELYFIDYTTKATWRGIDGFRVREISINTLLSNNKKLECEEIEIEMEEMEDDNMYQGRFFIKPIIKKHRLGSDLNMDKFNIKALVKYKINGKDRKKTLNYKLSEPNNIDNDFDEINKILQTLNVSKLRVYSKHSYEKLMNLIYNPELKKIYNKHHRGAKMQKIFDEIVNDENDETENN